jgi:hypothetical protein
MPRRDAWNLGIDEVSGLGSRRNPASGRPEVLAVGDREFAVALIEVEPSGRLPRHHGHRKVADRVEVRGLHGVLEESAGQSDWEGVAGDADGRVYLLRETGSTLVVLSPDFRFERALALRWETDGRNGLESLLLLRNGHVLSAAQEQPLRLLEFAVPGENPLGIGSPAMLPADQPMRLPHGRELHCIASWDLVGDAPRSANDLAVCGDHLFVISSVSRCVARFRLPTPEYDGLEPDGVWKLPDDVADGREEKAEGLLVDSRLGVLVGVDRRPGSRGPNLFSLDLDVGCPPE